MVSALPEPVERVSAFLRAAGAEARIEQLSAACHTAEEAADAVGCTVPQIVEAVALVCDQSAVVALVPGDVHVDPKAVAAVVGAAEGRLATPEEVARITGFAPGGVAPFPLAAVHHVLADRRIVRQRVVWVGGGSDRHLLALTPRELLRLSRARLAAIGRSAARPASA